MWRWLEKKYLKPFFNFIRFHYFTFKPRLFFDIKFFEAFFGHAWLWSWLTAIIWKLINRWDKNLHVYRTWNSYVKALKRIVLLSFSNGYQGNWDQKELCLLCSCSIFVLTENVWVFNDFLLLQITDDFEGVDYTIIPVCSYLSDFGIICSILAYNWRVYEGEAYCSKKRSE